jgi:hypothetical protein
MLQGTVEVGAIISIFKVQQLVRVTGYLVVELDHWPSQLTCVVWPITPL